jgi:beta-phosphoglucomutase family hydrolase
VSTSSWHAPAGTAGLIFDCDGTLADTMPTHFVAWTDVLARHGMTFDEQRFYALAGVPTSRIIRQLADEQGVRVTDEAIPGIAREKEHHYVAVVERVTPIDIVLDIAARYRGRLPMAVASGGEHYVITATLGAIGALDWFDAIVGAEDTEHHKPAPDVFLEAARRLGVAPAGCVVFEDSDLGLAAALRAGMTGIDVRRMVAR